MCHQPCSGAVSVQVTASSLHTSPGTRHLHCARPPAANSLLPGARGAPAVREQLLQPSPSPKPSWSHVCATGCTPTTKRGTKHPKSLQLETAGPCLAFEEGWSLGKRSGRVFTGCIWTSIHSETTSVLGDDRCVLYSP